MVPRWRQVGLLKGPEFGKMDVRRVSWSQVSHKSKKFPKMAWKSMPLDTPKSYFEYMNRNIFNAYAVFKKRPQGSSILRPTCLHFATLKGRKFLLNGFSRVSWLACILGPILSCFQMCLGRHFGGRKASKSSQTGAKRLSGGSQEGGGTAPKSTQQRESDQNAPSTPKRCCLTPSGDPFFIHFSIILGLFFW